MTLYVLPQVRSITTGSVFFFFWKDDEVVLQCTATVHKEQQKLCLAAEGFGNRLCFLESTSNSKVLLTILYVVFGARICL